MWYFSQYPSGWFSPHMLCCILISSLFCCPIFPLFVLLSWPHCTNGVKLMCVRIIFPPRSSWFFGTTFPLLLHHPDSIALLAPLDPHLLFKVTFSPSHSSLWAIGTICHYLWSWRRVFFSCLQPNPTISSSFLTSLSLPHRISFQAHCHRHNRSSIQSLSPSVCFRVFIRLSALLLWCYGSLPCLQRPRPRAHVSQFRGHPAPTSRLTRWLHQLTYGAHIWASSIRDGWPEGASAETKTSSQKADFMLEGCRMGGDISASICFTMKKRRGRCKMAYLLYNVTGIHSRCKPFPFSFPLHSLLQHSLNS